MLNGQMRVPNYLENCVVREPCKWRTACTFLQKKVFCKSKHRWLCAQKIYKLRQTKLSQFIYFSLVLREREERKTKYLAPYLEAAVAATNSKVNLAIVDIDVNSDLAMDHEVQAVPTVVAFKEGKMVDKFIGLLDEDKLDAFVTKLHQ